MLFTTARGVVEIMLGLALLPSAGDAHAWFRGGSSSKLCLLPFASEDALLPGESLQIHLFDPGQLALLDTAIRRDSGCVAMLLESESSGACAIAPLLELHEQRPCDDGGVQCSFGCVGAVHLRGVELHREPHEFLMAPEASAIREPRATVDVDSADDEEVCQSTTRRGEALTQRVRSSVLRGSGLRGTPDGVRASVRLLACRHSATPALSVSCRPFSPSRCGTSSTQ